MVSETVLLAFTAVGFFGFGAAAAVAALLFRGYVVSSRKRWVREEIREDVRAQLERERTPAYGDLRR